MLTVKIETVALAIRRIRPPDVRALLPINAEPLQVLEQLSLIARLAALDIGVFDAQDHDATLLPCEQPVEERGAGVADVQLPRGRRSETNANLGRITHSMMLTRVQWRADESRRYSRGVRYVRLIRSCQQSASTSTKAQS